jgi:hypothetical protein
MSKLTDIKAFRDAASLAEYKTPDTLLDSMYPSVWAYIGSEFRRIERRVSWAERMIKAQLQADAPPKPDAMRPEDV